MEFGESSAGIQITVACPSCHRATTYEAVVPGSSETCPACGTSVRIPALSKPGDAPARRPVIDAGEFSVAASPRAAPNAAPERIAVQCSGCSARLKAGATMRGKSVKCPRCGKNLIVPQTVPARSIAPNSPPEGEPEPQPPDVKSEVRKTSTKSASGMPASRLPREEFVAAKRPPKRLFTEGVFGFPWRPGCIPRWLATTAAAGLVLLSYLPIVILMSGTAGWQAAGNMVMGLALYLIALAVAAFSAAFASACLLEIVQDTAAGNDEVSDWPGSDWREWVLPGLAVVYWLAISVAPGALAARYLGFHDEHLLAVNLTSAWLLFPVVMLSALECGSSFVPLSGPVTRSLGEHAGIWLRFYVASGFAALPVSLAAGAIVAMELEVALAVLAPLIAWTWFVYGRLVGRLGWRISRGALRSHAAPSAGPKDSTSDGDSGAIERR